MSRLKSSLVAKSSTFVLLLFMLVVCVASSVGIIYLFDCGAYFDDGKNQHKDIIENHLYITASDAAYAYEEKTDYDGYHYDYFSKQYDSKSTNVAIKIVDEENKELYSNFKIKDPDYEVEEQINIFLEKEYEKFTKTFMTYQERWETIEAYEDKYYEFNYNAYDEDSDGDGEYECILEATYLVSEPESVTVFASVNDELNVKDELYYKVLLFDTLNGQKYNLILVGGLSLIIAITLFVFLLIAAGHKRDVEGIHLNWLDKIPFDLYVFVAGMIIICGLAFAVEASYQLYDFALILVILVDALFCVCIGLGVVLTFTTRVKYGSWWKNTVIYKVCHLIGKGFKTVWKAIPTMPKAFICIGVVFFLNFILIGIPADGFAVIVYIIEAAIAIPFITILLLQLRKLKNGIDNISKGDLETKIDTSNLILELRECGETINDLTLFLSREVNERMKSERFKTELITNVSHDIKTPLTSIINYVDLIKKKDIKDEELQDYINVLDRQSGRLKKLIEDLVECSKAQTGNVTVNKAPLDIGVLLVQTVGEYQEKLEAGQLSLVVDKPENPIYVLADGRLLWRSIENLLNNACKYSMVGTRVYLSLEQDGKEAIVTLKNISKERLNVSSEELMERFVRGDSSRNTEGSGLGLSIARSLIELQQGKMNISIDGDLFKVELRFGLIDGEYINA